MYRYYLERLAIEAMRLELEEKAGNLKAVLHHKVMIDTYEALLEKTFDPKNLDLVCFRIIWY